MRVLFVLAGESLLSLLSEIRIDAREARLDAKEARVSSEKARLNSERALRMAERAEWERLWPTRMIPSPSGSDGSRSLRSPQDDERFPLKRDTVEFYGLFGTRLGAESKNWTVIPMLPPPLSFRPDGAAVPSIAKPLSAAAPPVTRAPTSAPSPVLFKEAILSHIWPSEKAPIADDLGAKLKLERGYHISPRNFLILPKAAERAFDAEAITFLPFRERDGRRGARVRVLNASLVPADEREYVQSLDGCELWLPYVVVATDDDAGAMLAGGRTSPVAARCNEQQAVQRLPFLRLLAWRALGALRRRVEDDEAAAAVTTSEMEAMGVSVDELAASVDSEGNTALRAVVRRLHDDHIYAFGRPR